MNYQLAYLDLAAQVRRLGIVADVQVGETIHFGDNHDAHQMALAVLATVATLNELTLQLSNTPATPLEARSKQEADEDALELKLRTMFAAARFPALEDIYVASPAHCVYITTKRELTRIEISMAAVMDLQIERTPLLRNRYRVTFVAPDREEA